MIKKCFLACTLLFYAQTCHAASPDETVKEYAAHVQVEYDQYKIAGIAEACGLRSEGYFKLFMIAFNLAKEDGLRRLHPTHEQQLEASALTDQTYRAWLASYPELAGKPLQALCPALAAHPILTEMDAAVTRLDGR